jgi:hypothetical protein
MVYEAASRAMANTKIIGENGLPLVMYHGTNNDFTTFSAEKMRPGAYGDGFYFATTSERARLYGDRIISVFLNAKANNREAKRLGVEKDYIRTSAGDVIVKNPEQIKLADPVTYDDAGNVIPLSQRFNPQNKDIRYSVGGIFTGLAADYANRSREGGKDDGPSLLMIGTDEGVYKTSIDTKNPKTKDGRNTVIFRRDPRECDALLVESETIKAVEKALPENIKTGDKSIKYTESERIAVRNFVKEKAKA